MLIESRTTEYPSKICNCTLKSHVTFKIGISLIEKIDLLPSCKHELARRKEIYLVYVRELETAQTFEIH